MGLTGLLLAGFLVEHLHGNLKLYEGDGEAFNEYVEYLQEKSTGADFVNEDPIYVVSTGTKSDCRQVSVAYVLGMIMASCMCHTLHVSLPELTLTA